MRSVRKLALGLLLFGSPLAGYAQTPTVESTASQTVIAPPQAAAQNAVPASAATPIYLMQGTEGQPGGSGPASSEPNQSDRSVLRAAETGTSDDSALGPTPLPAVGILNNLIYGDKAAEAKIKFAGWVDLDYTFRSTGPGRTGVAPVINRFGDEATFREAGIYIYKPLDQKDWDWGFNVIFIGGSDASFLTPTAGGWKNTNPRFGTDFTDLNLTAHLPILTDGGVDVKAGRQTTVLGPQGALPWQRYFTSSDYAWYIEEEGRYTGVSANWHISKQLDWYNGVELGGWGVFFDNPSRNVNYITQINYWLDEEAKNTKVWTTVLTGPTGFYSPGNTTVAEVGIQHNWSKSIYQIVDSQLLYSKAPLFAKVTNAYQERAYDVYTYLGTHLSPTLDLNSRFEWFEDVDGNKYPGGLGTPKTNYFESTLGFDYHPTKWLQFRPEVRFDRANNPVFGDPNHALYKNQLSLAADLLLKF